LKDRILYRAIEIIDERGWIQGNYETPKKNEKLPGPVCAARAINLASQELGGSEEQRWDARNAVIALIGAPCIACWNDKGKTTKQEVSRILGEAARL
jgi:hypothetical protein